MALRWFWSEGKHDGVAAIQCFGAPPTQGSYVKHCVGPPTLDWQVLGVPRKVALTANDNIRANAKSKRAPDDY